MKGMTEDEVKEVIVERADQAGFEGYGKDFGFYCNGRHQRDSNKVVTWSDYCSAE